MKTKLALGSILAVLALFLTSFSSPAMAATKKPKPKHPTVSATYCLPDFTSNVGDSAFQVNAKANRIDKLVVKLKGPKGVVLRTSSQPVPKIYRKPGGIHLVTVTVFQGVEPIQVKSVQVTGSRVVKKSKKGTTRVSTTRIYKVKALKACK